MGEEQVFSAELITATMLGKLRDVASAALSTKVVDCVVSVRVQLLSESIYTLSLLYVDKVVIMYLTYALICYC